MRLQTIIRKPWVRKLLIFAGGAVALFVLLNYVALPIYVNHGGTLAVPNVTDVPLSDARMLLEKAGLEPVEAETRPDPDRPIGTVIFQNPSPQSVVKKGRRVYLTVSGGEILVVVPQLRGRSMRDAKFTLERYGLNLGSVSYETSTNYPENTIVAQSVGADSRIAKGSRVNIMVSSGSVQGGAIVPNLIGKTVTEAEKILRATGLGVGNITYQLSYELIPNTVVEQFPRAGEAVASGKNVDLFVVKVGKPAEEIQIPKH